MRECGVDAEQSSNARLSPKDHRGFVLLVDDGEAGHEGADGCCGTIEREERWLVVGARRPRESR
jgi:hypothetical protein